MPGFESLPFVATYLVCAAEAAPVLAAAELTLAITRGFGATAATGVGVTAAAGFGVAVPGTTVAGPEAQGVAEYRVIYLETTHL